MRAALAALALLLLALAGCKDASEPPRQSSAPRPHVVSLTPTLTDIVKGLGRAEHLVGVTVNCDAPGVPTVGDMRPNAERIAALRPDLVLVGAYPFLEGELERLRALGLPVLALPLQSLEDMRAALGVVGERLEAAEAAAAIASELDEALSEARAGARCREQRPRVMLVFDIADGYVFTTGGGDHLGQILAAVGLTNVAEGGPLTARLSLETVVTHRPELIIHIAPSERFPDDAAALKWWTHTQGLPAVGARRVHVWPNRELAKQGPGLAAEIRRLSQLVGSHFGGCR